MEWYAISGSWRNFNEEVKKDVRKTVREIVNSDSGIVTGGALGVDYLATESVLKHGNPKAQLRIYLPISLEKFCQHYLKRAEEGVITKKQAKKIVSQLEKIAEISPESIFDETIFKTANKRSYYARNTKIIKNSDALYAFQVNESKGVQDTIEKALRNKKQVYIKKYYLTEKEKISG